MTQHRPHRSSRSRAWGQPLPVAKSRMLKRNLLFLAITAGATATLALCSKAQAAGGAYVVDNGGINAPGECNVDLWYQADRRQGSNHNSVLVPACTFSQLPGVQLGAALQRQETDEHGETQLSPQVKLALLDRDDLGLQLALAGSAHWALNRSHSFDGGDLSLPLTFSPSDALHLNLSTGWSHAYDDGQQHHRWTWGTGVEYELLPSLTLIAERYGQRGGEQAWQAGPRLHIGHALDLDLILGQHLTDQRDRWLTTGVTLRF
ncbi:MULTISPECIES: hypothetical protein [unclassified Pseudomonas]|uniref:hypothetical protein n=1 Tax=unclassified Pseudomonas TaxID=196821 RepID=UPI0008380B46|nr:MULTISPECIES: hypothetical protein [unclassified Pseudomonas]QIH08433.1 hypothetical protein ATY02_17765 [Pseudomonas sp. BIOMIG1BAC]